MNNSQNQQTMNYQNFNAQTMNQMNQNIMNMNPNTLYWQNFQQTFQNMQPNMNLVNTNFNNMTNILSLLNLPIVVPYHMNHPLINCKTPGRDFGNNCWQCNLCKINYSYTVPTFYCTACDFDLCQKCLLSLNACYITIYNYSFWMNQNIYFGEDFTNSQFYNSKIHKHPMVRILREPCYFENKLKCNFCYKDILKGEQFHYCTLCNYCVCVNCYQNKINHEQFVDNPEYLNNDQMNPKK
jgi:hypothetical protein